LAVQPEPATARRVGLAGALDFLSDWAVVSFALWTLIAYGGMATAAPVSVLAPIWIGASVLAGAGLAVWGRKRASATSEHEPEAPSAPAPAAPSGRLVAVAAVAALVAAVLAASSEDVPWMPVWLALAVAIGIGALRLRSEPVAAEWGRGPGLPAHLLVVLTGVGFAVMSLFLRRQNLDDAFYVNRAMGVAELNRIPVRDIILTDEVLAPLSGAGLPVDAFSALEGAVGRLVGLHGASVAYYVAPPLFTFLATWALWRLLRSWAPRNVVLCFALGAVFWIFSGELPLTSGSYFLNRMWQGKVVFVAWLVLTVYVFLTRWLSKRDARTGVLLVASAVGSIGLTASATFVVPLVFGAAAIPLVTRRDWRGLPLLAGAAAIPFVVGLVASLRYPLANPPGAGPDKGRFSETSWYFHEVFGTGLLVAVGIVALCAAPWLVRSGAPARLAAGIALVTGVILAPFVLPLLNELLGLETILRRLLWLVPFPAFVGLLAAIPLGPLLARAVSPAGPAVRAARYVPALLVAALLAAFGSPLWFSPSSGDSLWASKPSWKADPGPLRTARRVLERYTGSGPVLAEPRIMYSIALLTTEPKAVNPRSFYTIWSHDSRQRIGERLRLTRFVTVEGSTVPGERVRQALADLEVGLVCIPRARSDAIQEIEAGGYEEDFEVGHRVCLRRE
jgi:hypothetical protein